jgi:hypothetical protein
MIFWNLILHTIRVLLRNYILLLFQIHFLNTSSVLSSILYSLMQLALQRQRVVDLYHTVEQYILQDNLLDYFSVTNVLSN